jgi:hypothetical protein
MGWRDFFEWNPVDYTDQLFRSAIKTTYAKTQFSLLLSMILTILVRWHVKLLLGAFIRLHPVCDFVFQIALSVFLVLRSNWIHNLVLRFQDEIYALSRYLINNYSPENYRIWKRNLTLVVCGYLLLYLLIFPVNNAILLQYLFQFLFSYFIVDAVETGKIQDAWQWIQRKTESIGSDSVYALSDVFNGLLPVSDPPFQKSWMYFKEAIPLHQDHAHCLVLLPNL